MFSFVFPVEFISCVKMVSGLYLLEESTPLYPQENSHMAETPSNYTELNCIVLL